MEKIIVNWNGPYVFENINDCEAGCEKGLYLISRFWGGKETITLPPGDRLVNITWKGGERETPSLWLLTKKDTTKPTTYLFKEKSNFGMLEGEITIKEQ